MFKNLKFLTHIICIKILIIYVRQLNKLHVTQILIRISLFFLHFISEIYNTINIFFVFEIRFTIIKFIPNTFKCINSRTIEFIKVIILKMVLFMQFICFKLNRY